MRGLATPDEASAWRAFDGDLTKSDAIVCAGGRAITAIALRLPADDLATYARWTVQR
jgi:hypothetical protein